MVGCSIRNCKSKSVKDGPIRFFSIPKKESLANEWLRYCGPKTTIKNGRVCSKHFLTSDYCKTLQQILLNESPPRKSRILKPDSIPSLHIDEILNYQNDDRYINSSTPSGLVRPDNNGISIVSHFPGVEGLSTSENLACVSKCNRIPELPNEVLGSSKVVEKSDESITIPVSEHNEVKRNANRFHVKLIKMVPVTSEILGTGTANEVSGSSKVVEKIDESITIPLAEHNYVKRNANGFQVKLVKLEPVTSEIEGTSENLKILSQCSTMPANEVSSKVVEKSGETITISLAEHRLLKRNAKEYKVLKKNLDKIFTSGQIRCLMKPNKNRVKWSAEDIAAAVSLKSISPKGYCHLRAIGIPLPAHSTLRKWATDFAMSNKNK